MEKLLRMNQCGKDGDRAEMSLAKDMNWMESTSPPVSVEDRSVEQY